MSRYRLSAWLFVLSGLCVFVVCLIGLGAGKYDKNPAIMRAWLTPIVLPAFAAAAFLVKSRQWTLKASSRNIAVLAVATLLWACQMLVVYGAFMGASGPIGDATIPAMEASTLAASVVGSIANMIFWAYKPDRSHAA